MRLIDRQAFFLKQRQKSRVYDTDRQRGYWAGVDLDTADWGYNG